MTEPETMSVVIPSYNRGQILLETLSLLEQQTIGPAEVLVIDQTKYLEGDAIRAKLQQLDDSDTIHWIRLEQPSIPKAMNTGLLSASGNYVLFLDDDVQFRADFIEQHLVAIREAQPIAQVGQIIQPWQQAVDLLQHQSQSGIYKDLNFPFNANQSAQIDNCMAGNLAVHRESAIKAGGFDENFEGVAYRFETEFCRRLIRSTKRKFEFVPAATLNHLHYNSGGTRSDDHHLCSTSPKHSVGDYYFALLEGQGWQKWSYILRRLFSSPIARFYLTRPWYIPLRLIGEIRGICSALQRKNRRQQLIHE